MEPNQGFSLIQNIARAKGITDPAVLATLFWDPSQGKSISTLIQEAGATEVSDPWNPRMGLSLSHEIDTINSKNSKKISLFDLSILNENINFSTKKEFLFQGVFDGDNFALAFILGPNILGILDVKNKKINKDIFDQINQNTWIDYSGITNNAKFHFWKNNIIYRARFELNDSNIVVTIIDSKNLTSYDGSNIVDFNRNFYFNDTVHPDAIGILDLKNKKMNLDFMGVDQTSQWIDFYNSEWIQFS